MLWQRVLTALILIPLVVWVVLYAPPVWFGIFFALITMVGAWEWAKLAKVPAGIHIWSYYVLIAVACLSVLFDLLPHLGLGLVGWVVFWCVTSVLLFSVPEQLLRTSIKAELLLWAGGLLLVGASVALMQMRAHYQMGPQLVMYLLLLIWIADSAAYFSGRAWGRRKLAVLISPNKSIEGAAGGLIACAMFAVGAGVLFQYEGQQLIGFVFLSLLVAMVSICGDLFESLIKRKVGVKDSGHILPGHGGVLDRIDSLIAATPCFAFGLLLIGGTP